MLKKIGKVSSILKLGIIYSWEKYHFLIPPKELARGIKKVTANLSTIDKYEMWIKNNEKVLEYKTFEYNPLISIVIPHYNTNSQYLKECIESVLNQSYRNFELCIADDCSTNEESINILKKYEEEYSQIKVVWRKENGNISAATNSAIEIAQGEYIAFMDSDDVLHKDALYWNVEALNKNRRIELIYSDEDKLDFDGNRVLPHFKPDWNPDLLLSLNYICHFVVAKANLVKELGGCRSEFDGAQDYDFLLRLTEKTNNIHHIPKMLYHWRILLGSTALSESGKPYIIEAWENVIKEALKRRNLKGTLIPSAHKPFHILFENNNEKVTIFVSVDNRNKLKNCLESIYKRTTYKNFEIILINESNKKIIKYDNLPVVKTFEEAIKMATGEYIVLLSGNVEIVTSNWIEFMLGYARQERIGFVGGNVDDKVPNLKENWYDNLDISNEALVTGYRNFVTCNYDCIDLMCCMISKDKFSGISKELPVCKEGLNSEYKNIYFPVVKVALHRDEEDLC